MNATARIAAAVAGGYLLGRTKKLKLAITVGSMLAGQAIVAFRRGWPFLRISRRRPCG